MRFLPALFTYLGDIVSCWQCACCDAPLASRSLLCPCCASTVVRYSNAPRAGRPIAYGYYGGALASCLRRLKYGNRPDIGAGLGQLLSQVIAKHAGDWEPTVLCRYRCLASG